VHCFTCLSFSSVVEAYPASTYAGDSVTEPVPQGELPASFYKLRYPHELGPENLDVKNEKKEGASVLWGMTFTQPCHPSAVTHIQSPK
jgi:hypothetical protein